MAQLRDHLFRQAGIGASGFIVRVELPGLKKDDVEVELTQDAVTIRGERREEREEERIGIRDASGSDQKR